MKLDAFLFIKQSSDVKKRIDNLIDREFLKRDEENPSVYLYQA